MDFLSFREKFIETGCVNTHQIAVACPDYNRNTLTRWVKQGLLTKLRNGYYSFPELRSQSQFALYLSNRIYKPSYISLLDLLYLYPFYKTKEALKELRLDEEWLSTEFDVVRLDDYTARFSNKTLAKRVQLMRTTYSL